MRIRFFMTTEDEFFADADAVELDDETAEWAQGLGIGLASRSGYDVAFESPEFFDLADARDWFEDNVEPLLDDGGEEIPGYPADWADDLIGSRVSTERFLESEDWGAADEDGSSVLGFWLPPGTCFAIFSSGDPEAEPDTAVVVFLDLEDLVVMDVLDSVWLKDEWGDYHAMDDELCDADVEHARELIMKILEPFQESFAEPDKDS